MDYIKSVCRHDAFVGDSMPELTEFDRHVLTAAVIQLPQLRSQKKSSEHVVTKKI